MVTESFILPWLPEAFITIAFNPGLTNSTIFYVSTLSQFKPPNPQYEASLISFSRNKRSLLTDQICTLEKETKDASYFCVWTTGVSLSHSVMSDCFLVTPWKIAHQALLSLEFSRQDTEWNFLSDIVGLQERKVLKLIFNLRYQTTG